MDSCVIIKLNEVYKDTISFRKTVTDLFNRYNKVSNATILIDFDKVKKISRSAADQYLIEKNKLRANNNRLVELHVSEYINLMFKTVKSNQRSLTEYKVKTSIDELVEG